MFYFVVRYFRWAARVPGFPQLFDTLLLTGTWIFRRSRLTAMEKCETEALRLPGVRLRIHRFGGVEFIDRLGRELGHLHGNGLLDACVGRQAASKLLVDGGVRPHHVLPCSNWVSFQIEHQAHLPKALELLTWHIPADPHQGSRSTQSLSLISETV